MDLNQHCLKTLHASGLRIVMATGDGLTTAKAVSAKLGIDEVHGEVKPADKLALVERDRKSTRLNSSHLKLSRMPSSA